MFFSNQIIHWFKHHKRDLPWRNTKDPYCIWLSEIILQQTRVNQGLPYYYSFLEVFPTVEALANASEDEVLKLWQGLGYYSRARNLHATAKFVTNELNGKFPTTKDGLLRLKGVGDYTASAIASFAYNEPEAVVDGNVNRVLSRYFGIDLPINERPGEIHIKEKANEVFNHQQPALHNQAIMEFGALQCTPKSPNCMNCPLQIKCIAFQQGKVNQLPIKLKKTKIQTNYLAYIVFVDDKHQTLVERRKGKGIWQNLYQFPVIEQSKKPTKKLVSDYLNYNYSLFTYSIEKANAKPIVHLLSHRKLIADFYIVSTSLLPHNEIPKQMELTEIDKLKNFAVPVLIANFINEFLLY